MVREVFVEGNTKKDNASADLAAASVLVKGLGVAEGVITKLLDAAKTNPLIGILVSLIVVDVLYKQNVIGVNTFYAMQIIIFSSVGIGLTSEILQDLTKIFNIASGASVPSVFTPTATVLVEGNTGNNDQLNALLAKLGNLKG